MANVESTCIVCGAQFPSRRGKKYCSAICKGRRPRVRTQARIAAAKWTCACKVCSVEFRPKHKDNNTICSRECGWRWLSVKASALRDGGRVSYTITRSKCSVCGIRFAGKGKYCSDGCRPSYYTPVVITLCKECGVQFNRSDDGSTRFFCSAECAEESRNEARRNSPSRRADKKRRKAMARGALGSEAVDVTKVFERDGYRCGICGSKTLQAKRGTYHPRAPELDHIVAISLGGSHTYDNVQCACRKCNGSKGAASLGQLHLFPAQ